MDDLEHERQQEELRAERRTNSRRFEWIAEDPKRMKAALNLWQSTRKWKGKGTLDNAVDFLMGLDRKGLI